MTETRCGFVAVLGASNVGKSTLVNALVGAKISIGTTPSPNIVKLFYNYIGK